jgi:hypothetical protein
VFVGLVLASLRRFLGGVIVDSLVKTEANKHPVSVIWALETSVLRDIAIISSSTARWYSSLRPSQARIDPQLPSGARSHLPSDIIRSSSGRPLSSYS